MAMTWTLCRTEAELIVVALEKESAPLAHELSAELRLMFGMVTESEQKQRRAKRKKKTNER
jgi:hypothetical protein